MASRLLASFTSRAPLRQFWYGKWAKANAVTEAKANGTDCQEKVQAAQQELPVVTAAAPVGNGPRTCE